jgi:hypothetical protein
MLCILSLAVAPVGARPAAAQSAPFVDLVPLLQAYQDQAGENTIPSSTQIVTTADRTAPPGSIWVRGVVHNGGTSQAGPFRVHVVVRTGDASATDAALAAAPPLLDQVRDCPALVQGGDCAVFENYGIALGSPVTKIRVTIVADPREGALAEFGAVREQRGTESLEYNNTRDWWYLIKKP